MLTILRYHEPGLGPRLGLCVDKEAVYDITVQYNTLAAWLQSTTGDVPGASQALAETAQKGSPACKLADISSQPDASRRHFLAPIDSQEVWAAGVTYERSRVARLEEAQDGGDVYSRVYSAERPELFFKSMGEKVVGPGASVGIRHDAAWSVPEPELAVVFNPGMQVVGFTIGNDMSSRDIEGANPLYLPQAKIYTASCALGPFIVLTSEPTWPQAAISLRITRSERLRFSGQTHTRHIHRGLPDLADYLGRCSRFAGGVFLLTGTGIVPPPEFHLSEGDEISIEIEGIGTLSNAVQRV